MGFLDNSGDIILDAVLTDLGRKRLAEGDFSITQFALGDDEINYTLYNPSHASGSAYYDLEIVQTPVLESFTNNTSTMKSRLITLTDNNLLYLPVIKEDNISDTNTERHSTDIFLVAVDQKTEKTGDFDDKANGIGKVVTTAAQRTGVLYGLSPATGTKYISLHQGIDNLNKPNSQPLSSALQEDSYVIQIDGRFGTIVNTEGVPLSEESQSQDDDGFIIYNVDLNGADEIVQPLNSTQGSPLEGSRGTQLGFKIKASDNLTDNVSYFDRFGFATTVESLSCKVIDTMVRVTGIKTGYSIDIPVRFIKDITS
jgi:hypothetical protein